MSGNNIYGDDIPAYISKLSVAQRNAYILMDLIQTPPHDSILVRSDLVATVPSISELGIYGVYIR
jgi:glutathione synthase